MKNFLSVFFKKNDEWLTGLADALETGTDEAIDGYMWVAHVQYMPATYDTLRRFKKPVGDNRRLKVHETHRSGNAALVIFDLPWVEAANHYAPILLDMKSEKIMGIILPFNELHTTVLSDRQFRSMSGLSSVWIEFLLKHRLFPS